MGRERVSETWMAAAVPQKGYVEGRYAVDKCLEFIQENGDSENKIIIKSDQEASIEYVIKDLVATRTQKERERQSERQKQLGTSEEFVDIHTQTLVEESPVKNTQNDGGSNGPVERAVLDIEEGIRGLLLHLETRLGVDIDARERIIAFIPEYAAYLMNRLRKGDDGKTPHERLKGKRPTILGVEFGEKV